VLVEPCAVRLIELFHVVEVPRRKELQKRAEVDGFVVVYVFERGIEARKKRLVGNLVIAGPRVPLLVKELLFALEVHLGELDEAFELQTDLAAVGSKDEHAAQFVECVHENAVLIIHGLNANDTFVTPRQKRHIFLQSQTQV
jgi:hypothetical protein